jgi:hypothetical protein
MLFGTIPFNPSLCRIPTAKSVRENTDDSIESTKITEGSEKK